MSSNNLLTKLLCLRVFCLFLLLQYATNSAALYSNQTKLIASDGKQQDRFTEQVAMHGDTVIIGASGHDQGGSESGAAYIYQKNQYGTNHWGEVVTLMAGDAKAGKFFGNSVAINGNTVVVGALGDDEFEEDAGAAYVFYHTGGSWIQIAKLSAEDSVAGDRFGKSVAVNGDIIVIGAHNHNAGGKEDAGAAYIFGRHQGGIDHWGQISKLTDPRGSTNDRFGIDVAIDKNTIAIGADNKNADLLDNKIVPENYLPQPRLTFTKEAEGFCGTDTGAVFIFLGSQSSNEPWQQVTQFTLSEAECSDHFGNNLAISGDTIAVGVAEKDIFDLLYAGKVYLYDRNHGGVNNWGETAIITTRDAREGDHFGYSIALLGDQLVVGAEADNQRGFGSGSATLFTRQNGSWRESHRLYASDAASSDGIGSSIALNGQAIVVGAVDDDDSGLSSGSAYVFHDQPVPASAALYSPSSGVLSLQAVDVPGLGLYAATFSRDTTGDFVFSVDQLNVIESTASVIANYAVENKILRIPSVELEGANGPLTTYDVDLRLINNSPMQFKLIRVR